MSSHHSARNSEWLILPMLVTTALLIAIAHLSVNQPAKLTQRTDVIRLTNAQFLFREDVQAVADQPDAVAWDASSLVELPHVWVHAGLRKPGIGWYRIHIDTERTAALTHLLIPRVGVNGQVYVNGTNLLPMGDASGERLYRPWNTPHLLQIPAGLLKNGTNTLVIKLYADRIGYSGMASLYLGPADPLFYFYKRRVFMQNTFASVSVGLLLFATVALLLGYFEFRQEGYLILLSIFFLLLAIRIANFSFFDVPKNSDAFERAIYSLHFLIVGLSHAMTLTKANLQPMGVRWTVWAFVGVSCTLIWLVPQEVALDTAGALTALSLPLSLLLVGWIMWRIRQAGTANAWLHVSLILSYFAMALNDWSVISLPSRFEENLLSHYLGTIAVAVISLYLIRQLIAVYRSDQMLRDTLQNTLEARDRTIAEQVGALVKSEKRRLTEQQGRLLMTEMHDGIGSVLVALRLMLNPAIPAQQSMATTLERCLDDLRLTLVAVDPDERSLCTLLAKLRSDYQPLLEQARIGLRWSVAEQLDELEIDPAPRLHIARIVQEALTNVLKHAQASEVEVTARYLSGEIEICVCDNGRGYVTGGTSQLRGHGVGLRGMRVRASEAGFSLRTGNRTGGSGFEVVLRYRFAPN